MDPMTQLFIGLLLTGLLLIGVEIYLPGGVVGVLGAMALIGAGVVGFTAFGFQGGFLAALGILFLSGACLFIWLKYFPKTSMGRRLTLSQDGKAFKATADFKALIGKTGEAVSDLRPSGIALIEGHRYDVTTDNTWIVAKERVVVSAVEGNRILVKPLKPQT